MLFDFIPQEIYNAISDYAKILIPSFITYFVTKYAFTRQHKYEIKEKQFNLVYLPLYLLTNQYMNESPIIFKKCMPTYIKKVEKIFFKHYQYVYPKTLRQFEKLKTDGSFIAFFEYQLTFDYEGLKRELGYPTNSLLDLFHRLTRIDKIIYLIAVGLLTLAIFCIVNAFTLFLSGDLLRAFSALVCFGISIFTIYILGFFMRR